MALCIAGCNMSWRHPVYMSAPTVTVTEWLTLVPYSCCSYSYVEAYRGGASITGLESTPSLHAPVKMLLQ